MIPSIGERRRALDDPAPLRSVGARRCARATSAGARRSELLSAPAATASRPSASRLELDAPLAHAEARAAALDAHLELGADLAEHARGGVHGDRGARSIRMPGVHVDGAAFELDPRRPRRGGSPRVERAARRRRRGAAPARPPTSWAARHGLHRGPREREPAGVPAGEDLSPLQHADRPRPPARRELAATPLRHRGARAGRGGHREERRRRAAAATPRRAAGVRRLPAAVRRARAAPIAARVTARVAAHGGAVRGRAAPGASPPASRARHARPPGFDVAHDPAPLCLHRIDEWAGRGCPAPRGAVGGAERSRGPRQQRLRRLVGAVQPASRSRARRGRRRSATRSPRP